MNCEAKMTFDHQCDALDTDSDGNWEDIENECEIYPTIELDCEDWDEKYSKISLVKPLNP